MPLREPVKVIGDVLKAELELDDGHIMLENQKWDIPKSPGLYIALSYIDSRPIANVSHAISAGDAPEDGMTEKQSVTMLHLIQIDLMSADSSARTRMGEVMMALRSLRAERAMEENNLQMARQPSNFVNVSSLEETVMLNRFTGTISVTALHTKEKAVEQYYNEFRDPEVTVNE